MLNTTHGSLTTDEHPSDLGPLAWVFDELRKSLDGATKTIKRFVRESEQSRHSELEMADPASLRIARQQLHQAVGALEMVGLQAPAQVVRAMEAAVQRFVHKPQLCTEEAAGKVERSGFALMEYLEAVLHHKPAQPVALFPAYREAQALAGAERVHPADLWPFEQRGQQVAVSADAQPLQADAQMRSMLDRWVLLFVKTQSPAAAQQLAQLCAGLSAGTEWPRGRTFWRVAAAFFEAASLDLLPPDLYVKRAASRILLQFASFVRPQTLGEVSETLLRDLLFFCAQANPAAVGQTLHLHAVRETFGLLDAQPVNYAEESLGRFDPALLALARKRIAVAKESWSLFSGGDVNGGRKVVDQYGLIGDSLAKLHPASTALAQALVKAVGHAAREASGARPELSMEVATTTLYLEAVFEDFDPTQQELTERTLALAERLERVLAGEPAQPLDSWMEKLYRRVSERQTMGSVVGELKVSLGAVEKSLDQFFRAPAEKTCLHVAVSQLAQMRGVLSVLGLEQAVYTVNRMRASVERMLDTEVDQSLAREAGTFQQLGNNLSALSFLVDMLSYQPALAKKLFVFDESLGELLPLMGRTVGERAAPEPVNEEAQDIRARVQRVIESAQAEVNLEELSQQLNTLADQASLAERPGVARAARDAAQAVVNDDAAAGAQALVDLSQTSMPLAQSEPPALNEAPRDGGDDLLDIFLQEAREVVRNAQLAVQQLQGQPADLEHLTTLRRAFHTLKGSARMVGLKQFGEAGWALEQLFNAVLAEQSPAAPGLLKLAEQSLSALGRWVEDIARHTDAEWTAQPFCHSADIWRTQALVHPLALPGTVAQTESKTEPEPEPESAAERLTEPQAAPNEALVLAGATPEPPSLLEGASEALPAGLKPVPFVFDFDLNLDAVPPLPDVVAQPPPLAGIDFAALALVSSLKQGPEETQQEAALEAAAVVEPKQPEPPEAPMDSDLPDEQTKLIGPLRIGIKLYNVYLNEADEWSRRLCNGLAEWALERHEPVHDQAEALAHALAGASATVGFQPLSNIARALEHAIGAISQHQQLGQAVSAQEAQLFVDASEDIRRLLHQFAAGFYKEPNPGVLAALDLIRQGSVTETEAFTKGPELAPLPTSGGKGPVQDIDDDIDVLDTIDVDLFPIFTDEALELLPQLAGALRQWVARPDNGSARGEVLRNLHTLKGSARLAGALRLGEMVHRMEAEAERLGSDVQRSADVEPLLASFDAISARLELLRHTSPETQGVVQTAPEQAPDGVEPRSPGVALEWAAVDASPHSSQSDPVETAPSAPVLAQGALIGLDLRQAPIPVPVRAGAAVRVRPELLDRLVNQAGEVMITRSRMESQLLTLRASLKDLNGNLERLRHQLREMELQAETQMQSRLAQARDADQTFDPLEFDRFTRVQELTRMMAESVNDVATVQRNLQRAVESTEDGLVTQARQTRELQRDLLRTRMVEFEGISERLYRVVRQASKETGKQVRLDITGGHIEMDRGVLDRMTAAFEHLLRNSVVHGIEAPEARLAMGKAAEGHIDIRLAQEQNDVSVVFEDDGAGLDLKRLREKALAQGIVAPGTELSDEQAAELVFTSGLSTATEVSSLAGRGVGMDVVRNDVLALGGRIETSTHSGAGVGFKLVLPLTTAVTQVVMVRAGALTFGVPSNLVELVRRVSADELARCYAKGTLTVGAEEVPFYWAGALLQSSPRSVQAQGRTLPVVIFRSAAQRVAMHLDEVLGNQEVVVKNLGPQLSRLPGLAAMSVLASGAVALIYNPVALATVYGAQVPDWVAARAHLAEPVVADVQAPVDLSVGGVPLVLVVDDSITVRRVTQRLLQREGYRVSLAADGLQALERLQQERPSVVLSDIEMPRMDGFDLVRNIRSDARLAGLPVIMITSRIADKHREHARELGVDHYLGKPYSEDQLLALVAHYAKMPAQA